MEIDVTKTQKFISAESLRSSQIAQSAQNKPLNPQRINPDNISAEVSKTLSATMKNFNGSVSPRVLLNNPKIYNNLIHRLSLKFGLAERTVAGLIRNVLLSSLRNQMTVEQMSDMINDKFHISQGLEQVSFKDQLSSVHKNNSQIIQSLTKRPEGVIDPKTDRFVDTKGTSGVKPPSFNNNGRLQELRNKASVMMNRHDHIDRYTDNLRTNQKYASWLVNNPPALVMTAQNPKLTSSLMAVSNHNIIDNASSILMANLIGLAASQTGDYKRLDTDSKEQKSRERYNQIQAKEEAQDHMAVGSIKGLIGSIPSKSLKGFLLEAERFVEEEIALFYSIQKSIEREIKQHLLPKNVKTKQKDKFFKSKK